MCVCVCVSSLRPTTLGVDYSFIEYMKNIIQIYVSAQCMVIVNPLFLRMDITKFTFRAYIV